MAHNTNGALTLMRIIGGKFRGKTLSSPSDDSIRPTSDRARESIFNILGSRLGPVLAGKRVLDLFAGTGALGLEALSRGAEHVTFVDTGAEARGLIRDHIQAFGAAGITKLLRRDATALGTPGTFGQFDLIFLDPPYNQGLGEKALAELAWMLMHPTSLTQLGQALQLRMRKADTGG